MSRTPRRAALLGCALLFLLSALPAVVASQEIRSGDFVFAPGNLNTLALLRYEGSAAEAAVPAQVDGVPVTSIAGRAFQDNLTLTKLTLPEGLLYISLSAMSGCKNLKEAVFPESLLEIGGSAFENCDALVSVTLPGSVAKIGENAFSMCESLSAVNLPGSLKELGDAAFSFCPSLTELSLPAGIETIGDNPFVSTPVALSLPVSHPRFKVAGGVLMDREEKRLIAFPFADPRTEYEVPRGIASIGGYAFFGCRDLTKVMLPEGIAVIGRMAFSSCPGLTSVILPRSLAEIRENAFRGCSGLTEIILPDNLVSIGAEAFHSCANLARVDTGKSLTSIGPDAFKSSPLVTLTVSAGSFAQTWAQENAVPYTVK